MAKLLWGNVYYKDILAGYLREEINQQISFVYDNHYLNSGNPPISHTLPLQNTPHVNTGLHPFFDNLVAEGWLEHAQTRLLGKRIVSRFELLLTFGYDCAGAVSIIDPEPAKLSQAMLDMQDPKDIAILNNRASLSGVQPKLTIIEKNGKFIPSKINELSTHIAKFPSQGHADLVINEYLTTLAFKKLLPKDNIVDLWIGEISGFNEPALIIKRFDRSNEGKIHFEEFNQLLGKMSTEKYNASHKEMADFLKNTRGCLPAESYNLYGRILAGFLLGNTDMHLKNFALFRTNTDMRLTPSYDQVSASLYDYKTLALSLGGVNNLPISNLKTKHIITLGEEFSLPKEAINMLVRQLEKNKEAAKQAIFEAKIDQVKLKDQLISMMEKRWNGTFALIGQHLLKKQ